MARAVFRRKGKIFLYIISFGIIFSMLLFIFYGNVFFHKIRRYHPKSSRMANTQLKNSIGKRSVIKKRTSNLHVPSYSSFIQEIKRNLTHFIRNFHYRIEDLVSSNHVSRKLIWQTYLEIAKESLLTWNLNAHAQLDFRKSGSIFVSINSFRDPMCPITLQSIFGNAENPENLFVALIQESCFERHCLGPKKHTDGKHALQKQDLNCFQEFCDSFEGKRTGACLSQQIVVLNLNETEGLGPNLARYAASLFYRGQEYFLQVDAHSEFVLHWDTKLIKMHSEAPAHKPIISSHPLMSGAHWMDITGPRICDAEFTRGHPDDPSRLLLKPAQIYDTRTQTRPRYAPFVSSMFLFGKGAVLRDVPLDPLLPFVELDDEVLFAARLWTSGYDLFSPTINVLNYNYNRESRPNYKDSLDRFFGRPVSSELHDFVVWRVRHVLGLAGAVQGDGLQLDVDAQEALDDGVAYRIEEFGMGTKRSYSEYLQLAGINPANTSARENVWCHKGLWPKLAKRFKIKKSRRL